MWKGSGRRTQWSWRPRRGPSGGRIRLRGRGRFARAFKKVSDWCKMNRHASVEELHAKLQRKLAGHYAYYGITGNDNMLASLPHQVTRRVKMWLSRGSHVGHTMGGYRGRGSCVSESGIRWHLSSLFMGVNSRSCGQTSDDESCLLAVFKEHFHRLE